MSGRENEIKRLGTEINNLSTKKTDIYLVTVRERKEVKTQKWPPYAFLISTYTPPCGRAHGCASRETTNENFQHPQGTVYAV